MLSPCSTRTGFNFGNLTVRDRQGSLQSITVVITATGKPQPRLSLKS